MAAGSAGARLALPAVAQSAIIASAQYNSRANMQHLEGFLVLAGRRGQAAARRGRACSPCPRRPTPASTIDRGRQPLSQCTEARFGARALRMASALSPRPAQPEEWSEAFSLLFQHLDPDQQACRSATAFNLLETGELKPDGIFVLSEDGQVTGVLVCTRPSVGVFW